MKQLLPKMIDSQTFSAFCEIESSNQVPNGRYNRNISQHTCKTRLAEKIISAGSHSDNRKRRLILNRRFYDDRGTIINQKQKNKRDSNAHSVKKVIDNKAHIGVSKNTE